MEKIFGKLNHYFGGKWHSAVLDLQKGRWILPPKPSYIPYLKYQNARGNHILIQPVRQENFLLADDISWTVISRHHKYSNGQWKPGRMIIETSPRNFQVWIKASRPLPLDEKRYWLCKLKSDPGADPNNRWGRCPGFMNRKAKYRNQNGFYPVAKLIWVDWKNQANIPFPKWRSTENANLFSLLPQGGMVCRHKTINRSDYEKGNHSITDFSYAMALARRGYSTGEIKDRILSERTDWNNHQGEKKKNDYLNRTVEKVMSIIRQT